MSENHRPAADAVYGDVATGQDDKPRVTRLPHTFELTKSAFVFGANGQDGRYFSLLSTGFETVVESAPRAERAMTPSA